MHPILFHLGSFPVHSYGVMIALAFLAGLWTATRRARREKISGDIIGDVTLWLMLGGIVGARAVYVVTYWQDEFAGGKFLGNFCHLERRAGLLRRAHRRDVGRDDLRRLEKTAALENRRRAHAEYRARQRVRAHWLPAQRLLLWPLLRRAVGHHFSRRPRNAPGPECPRFPCIPRKSTTRS